MPYADRSTRAIIALYNRCRSWESLPEPGGMLDQPETMMALFDLIDGVIADYRKREAEEREREAANREAQRRLDGRH